MCCDSNRIKTTLSAGSYLHACSVSCALVLFVSGHSWASDHAPGGGAVSGGSHLHWGLPPDVPHLPVQPHASGQETSGMVQSGQSQRHGQCVCVCIGLSVSYSVVLVVNNGLHVLTYFGISQVTRIVLLWVNNHFNDFEGDPVMTQFLEDFEKLLDSSVSVDIRRTQTDSIKQGSYGREKHGHIRDFYTWKSLWKRSSIL